MSNLNENCHRDPATEAPPPVPTPPQPIIPRFTSTEHYLRDHQHEPFIHLSPGCGEQEAREFLLKHLAENPKPGFNPLRGIEQLNMQEKDSGKFRIMSMSPRFVIAHQSVEVTFVGSFTCDSSDVIPLACMFGDVEVPIRFKREGVVCCEAPLSCRPGKVSVYFTSADQKACSNVRKFEYVQSFNRCPKCKNSKFKTPQQEDEENIELLEHVRMVQMVQPNPPAPAPEGDLIFDVSKIPKGRSREDDHIRGALEGTATLPPPLKELLIARLHDWLSEKYPARDDSKEDKRASDTYIEWSAGLDRKMMLSVAAYLISNAGDFGGATT